MERFLKGPEKCRGYFSCRCALCDDQALNKYKPPQVLRSSTPKTTHESKDFAWLAHQLGQLPYQTMRLPETVFYKDGKALFLFGTKEAKTVFINNSDLLKPNSLIKIFTKLARKRKKEVNRNSIYKFTSPDLQTEVYGKDIAIVKYTNSAVRVMSETEFTALMYERAGSSVWKELDFIQSVVKTRAGIGLCELVEYSEGDENLFTPLADALASLHWKLVSARGEVQTDDDGTQWLFSIENLIVEKQNHEIIRKLPPLRMRPESREVLSNSLIAHSQLVRKRVQHLTGLMTNYYHKIRDKVQVEKIIGGEYNVRIPKKELPFVIRTHSKTQKARSMDPRNTHRTLNRLAKFKNIVRYDS